MKNKSLKDFPYKIYEPKWRLVWEKLGIYQTPKNVTRRNKFYILPQLPYPSGSGLHVGHAEVYSACDIYARFKRMKGKKVLQVMGWDAFGLPAENYAIKTNIHPRINTNKAIDNFRDQIKKMGVSVDWNREVGSHNPDYYKWTQWFFLLMYNQGLAYRKKQKVNWCDSCKTVLANEQVVEKNDKKICERCDTQIEFKMMEQWYLKITDYADKLYKDLDKVDWPKESIKRQRDWIGPSKGALVTFDVYRHKLKLNVFTTRPDTLFGVTFMAIAPEHTFVLSLITPEQKDIALSYIKKAISKNEIERSDITKEKTGVFTGSYAINPINNKKVPIFISDYVLLDYGTGVVMGVPAHDKRDYDFAKKYNLDIITVLKSSNTVNKVELFTGKNGILVNSGEYTGLDIKVAQKKIVNDLSKLNRAEWQKRYKLRDWSVSRQRFWGAPIPMLHKKLKKQEEKLNCIYRDKPNLVLNFSAFNNKDSVHQKWLKEKLQEDKISFVNPNLPLSKKTALSSWIKKIVEELKEEDQLHNNNVVIIGRSLGAWSALKFSEDYEGYVRKLILLAPVIPTRKMYSIWRKYMNNEEIKYLLDFVSKDLDWKKIEKKVGEVVIFLATDDKYIDLRETKNFFEEKFTFLRIKRFRNRKHFNIDKFDELLNEILLPVHLDLKPIPEKDLPVVLPDDVDFKPTGQSPLTYSNEFQKGVKEKYGDEYSREPDTLDTFMCSSWYYYRYLDPRNDKEFASKKVLDTWMPVDFYLGGPEHVNGHLLYSRFFTKVLYDAGFIDFDEPFLVHRHQGLILGEDHRKMSKRWGNVVNPSDVVDLHGADTLRMYEMFMGPLEDTKPWSSSGVLGIKRFLAKVYNLNNLVLNIENENKDNLEQEIQINKLIKKVESDIERLSFNTAISEMMKFVNFLVTQKSIQLSVWKRFLLVLAPFAPFIAEELWHKKITDDETESIHLQSWPVVDEKFLKNENNLLVIQINGKLRAKINVDFDKNKDDIINLALNQKNIRKFIKDKNKIKNIIFIPNKLVNFVI